MRRKRCPAAKTYDGSEYPSCRPRECDACLAIWQEAQAARITRVMALAKRRKANPSTKERPR